MYWIGFIGAIGIGAIATKILDIWWLQKTIEERETRKWLRDHRLKAYTNLCKNLLSFGLSKDHRVDTGFEFYSLAIEAMLLLEDEELIRQIDRFIVAWDGFISKPDDERTESEYNKLSTEAREIMRALRVSLLNTK